MTSDNRGTAIPHKVVAQWNKARVTEFSLPHFNNVQTPVFMPVGTQGTVKGLTSQQLRELNCQIILGNTYHLGHRPGPELFEKVGGLHKFINWDRGILTDSGGFQMVSLLKFAQITEEGVKFQSPHDGSEMILTPEYSMHIQNQIGADIMMALDDVVSSTTTGPRVEEAMHRTIRWIDRCIKAHKRVGEQHLFGIVQGGLDDKLRDKCIEELIKRDLPGYAIGGLSGGESKDSFWRIVDQCCQKLPKNKPRYLMGVGYAVDLVVCSALGVDMFDCVYPSRTARFGTALITNGTIHLKSKEFEKDYTPLDINCNCMVCAKYTRAYLHTIVGDQIGAQLLTYHNIAYQMNLMSSIRKSIMENSFKTFVLNFMKNQFPNNAYPKWTRDALASAGIEL